MLIEKLDTISLLLTKEDIGTDVIAATLPLVTLIIVLERTRLGLVMTSFINKSGMMDSMYVKEDTTQSK